MSEGTTAVERYDASAQTHIRTAILGWLAGFKGGTRANYTLELRLFNAWLEEFYPELNLFKVLRPYIEEYGQWCEAVGFRGTGCRRTTVAHKLAVISSFYKWVFEEDILPRNPAARVRRPKLDYLSTRSWLNRDEARRFMAQASMAKNPRDLALACLLLLNGLRISEALNADIEDLCEDRGHQTITVTRKGGKRQTLPLSPPTFRAVYAYIGERKTGPIFVGVETPRMGRHAASRTVKRLAKRAGIKKDICNHSLRHSFITEALNDQVPLRDVQHSAGHASAQTTSHYDHGHDNYDHDATHVVSAFLT